MKKIIAMVLVLMAITAAMTAVAEASVKSWRIGTDESGKPTYFVTYTTELGTEQEFQVQEAEFSSAVEKIVEKNKEDQRRKEVEAYQANRGGWIKDVGAWISFWNPDD